MQMSSKCGFLLLSNLFVAMAIQVRATTVQDQIRYLLDEEKSLRQALQSRVQQLSLATAKLNSSIGKFLFSYFQRILVFNNYSKF